VQRVVATNKKCPIGAALAKFLKEESEACTGLQHAASPPLNPALRQSVVRSSPACAGLFNLLRAVGSGPAYNGRRSYKAIPHDGSLSFVQVSAYNRLWIYFVIPQTDVGASTRTIPALLLNEFAKRHYRHSGNLHHLTRVID
jgi:hypothetical protein